MSTNTGTRPAIRIGFTVVGKPVAAVITSSPGRSRRSFSLGEVRVESATRLAEEPEFTVRAWRAPSLSASRASQASLNRPVVSQKSSAQSTRLCMSDAA